MQPESAADLARKVREVGLSAVQIALEDEAGLIDVAVRSDVYVRYRQVFRGTRSSITEGVVQRKGSVINLLALRAAVVPHS